MLRTWIALCAIVAPLTAGATTYEKILHIAACPQLSGPPTYPEYAFTANVDDTLGSAFSDDGGAPSVFYCDAQLPAEATAFDFAELEYRWFPYQDSPGPGVAAYLDGRTQWPDGGWYSVTEEIGECQVTVPSSTLTMTQPLCATTGSASVVNLDGEAFPLSVHLLVFIPPVNDYTVSEVSRLIVHFEAP